MSCCRLLKCSSVEVGLDKVYLLSPGVVLAHACALRAAVHLLSPCASMAFTCCYPVLLPCRPARYAPLFGGRQYHPDREREAPSIEEQVRTLASFNNCAHVCQLNKSLQHSTIKGGITQ